MFRTVVGVDGMACSHCEKHLCDAITEKCQVKKVTASHEKKECEIISENELDEAKIREAVESCGFKFLEVKSEPYEKKGFLSSLFGK